MTNPSAQALAGLLSVSILLSPVLPAYAQPPPAGVRAGQVSARVPEATISRPGLRLVADVGVGVEWNDLVETLARGRVRITLGDGSTLNVGSDSRLIVVQHDQQTRQTDLELSFGKMRSRLQAPGPGQRFEIRTNTAVIGVIGTDFFVEATATMTRVIVYEGVVLVRNINPAVAGEKRVPAGTIVLIYLDQPPFDPQPAEPAEVQQSLDDTSVGAELPGPPSRPGMAKRLGGKKWFWIAAIAAAATLAIAIPLATGGTDASGCEVPEPSCP